VRAVVLVGGFGTRLRPLTLGLPKQMLPVVGVTMLERVVSALGAAGVTEAVLSLGYRPDAFMAAFPEGRCAGVQLRYAVEPEPLDTAGAIRFAATEAGIEDRFLALNGDVLTDLDITGLWARHSDFGGLATIALTPVEDPSRYGVVPLKPDGRVEAFVEKPEPGTAPSHWVNAGTYVLEPEVLELVEPARKVSIEREVFPILVEQGLLYGVQSDAYWIDAGTPEAYLQAQLDILGGALGRFEQGIDSTARIDPSAEVVSSVIGSDGVVGANAKVVESVLMDGVRIGAGCVLERALVGAHAVVGEGSVLTNLSVIGADVEVPAGTHLSDQRLPPPEDWPST
jgi:mannose-1-phosphate guanylyltransferase